MNDAHEHEPSAPTTLISSSANALAVYTNEYGDVVLRHQDAFGEADTLMVIPHEYAASLAAAIGKAARSPTRQAGSSAGLRPGSARTR